MSGVKSTVNPKPNTGRSLFFNYYIVLCHMGQAGFIFLWCLGAQRKGMVISMKQEELNEVLRLHKLWLRGDESGKRADLQDAELRGADLRDTDLQDADLQRADLRGADLRRANLQLADLQNADLQDADLQDADLQRADLRDTDLWDADLRDTDLRGADVDYSCWPLWCGSLGVQVDRRIAAQLAYHFCSLDCEDPDYIAARNSIIAFANTFHRVNECGRLEPKEVKHDE